MKSGCIFPILSWVPGLTEEIRASLPIMWYLGAYLDAEWGDDYVNIATTAGVADTPAGRVEAPPTSVDGVMRAGLDELHLLRARRAPESDAVQKELTEVASGWWQEYQMRLDHTRAFDAYLYIPTVRPVDALP